MASADLILVMVMADPTPDLPTQKKAVALSSGTCLISSQRMSSAVCLRTVALSRSSGSLRMRMARAKGLGLWTSIVRLMLGMLLESLEPRFMEGISLLSSQCLEKENNLVVIEGLEADPEAGVITVRSSKTVSVEVLVGDKEV